MNEDWIHQNYGVHGNINGFKKLVHLTAVVFSQIRIHFGIGSKEGKVLPEDSVHTLRYHIRVFQNEHFQELKQALKKEEQINQHSKTSLDFTRPSQSRRHREGRTVGTRPKKYVLLFTNPQTRSFGSD